MTHYNSAQYDRYMQHNEQSRIHKMKETYWTTKQAVIKKLGKKEDQHVVASDHELDSKLEVFKAVQKSSMDLLRTLEKYQDRLCALSQEENAMGRFLKTSCQQDKTRAGKMMAAVGKSLSFSSQQRLALRVPLVRLYQEVETFRYRAISDTLMTINRMESARTEYRGALLWMKNVSEELDPDMYKQLEKFRKVQAQVKKTKAKFDRLKLDCMQKIDLLVASRCNMYSHVLANYQTTLLHFWSKTSHTLTAVSDSFKGYQYYEFNMLKELCEPSKKLAEETKKKKERAERDIDGLKSDGSDESGEESGEEEEDEEEEEEGEPREMAQEASHSLQGQSEGHSQTETADLLDSVAQSDPSSSTTTPAPSSSSEPAHFADPHAKCQKCVASHERRSDTTQNQGAASQPELINFDEVGHDAGQELEDGKDTGSMSNLLSSDDAKSGYAAAVDDFFRGCGSYAGADASLLDFFGGGVQEAAVTPMNMQMNSMNMQLVPSNEGTMPLINNTGMQTAPTQSGDLLMLGNAMQTNPSNMQMYPSNMQMNQSHMQMPVASNSSSGMPSTEPIQKQDKYQLDENVESVNWGIAMMASTGTEKGDRPDLFIDFGEEDDRTIEEIKKKQDEEFDFSGQIIKSMEEKKNIKAGKPDKGDQQDLLSSELEIDESEKDDMTLLNEILNTPGGDETDFAREWQAVFGNTPLSSGAQLTPVESEAAGSPANFMPSNLLDMTGRMSGLQLGGSGAAAGAVSPTGASAAPQQPKQPSAKSKKGQAKDMSAWFSLFADLDPLANPDAIGKQGGEMEGAL